MFSQLAHSVWAKIAASQGFRPRGGLKHLILVADQHREIFALSIVPPRLLAKAGRVCTNAPPLGSLLSPATQRAGNQLIWKRSVD